MTRFVATCAQGLEFPLARELATLGAGEIAETRAGVHFSGGRGTAMRVCLWSRFASRVLLPLAAGPVADPDQLHDLAHSLRWGELLPPGCRFAVSVSSRHPGIGNTHFAALRVKDAVVDQLGREVVIDTRSPMVRLYAFCQREESTIGLDLSTRPLHARGYRRRGGSAPLKENLAAALLWRAGWPEPPALLDPFCGSGTLLIEAAWMACDVAPGLLDPHFGFRHLPDFDAAQFARLLEEARERRAAGLRRRQPRLLGRDGDPGAITAARRNAEAAGVAGLLELEVAPIRDLQRPGDWPRGAGLVACNPPWGERLESGSRSLHECYRVLGDTVAEALPGARLAVLTAHDALAREIDLPLEERYRLYNGPLPCRLFLFQAPDPPRPLGEGASMVANRIGKNRRRLRAYLRRGAIECYRAYDADLPEYAVAVDVFGDRLHVQEYAAPASIPAPVARRRLREALAGARSALAVPPGRLFLKTRSRQRGQQQYRRQGEEGARCWVREAGLEFEVNLSDYLDTGLFLDHRETRRRVRAAAAGQRFLNLFCYTGSVTVHAAAGGARATTSVDLSQTYLDWARRNLERNGFQGGAHELVRADCLGWLARERGRYDLVFLDPPTFSNSKAMRDTLDIQRDHRALLELAMARLAPAGLLIFSTNARRFRLDPQLSEHFDLREITAETTPPDFARRPPHRCWEVRHRGTGGT